jgi:uncharacterized protein
MLDLDVGLFFVVCGFITSFVSTILGLGGGWLITPMLHLWGLPMQVAAGTSLFAMLGSSFSSVWKHHSLKRIDPTLSALLCLGSFTGIQVSSFMIKNFSTDSISENLRWLFIAFLTTMACSLLYKSPKPSTQTSFFINPENNPTLQYLFITIIGGLAGILGGLLGVGGGFIVVPLLMYALKLPKQKVVAASALSILLASLSGSVNYGFMGLIRFDYGCSLLLGGVFGGYWAASIFSKFKDIHMRSLFIQSLLLMIASLVLKQMRYDDYGKILIFITAGSLFLRMLFIIREQSKITPTV